MISVRTKMACIKQKRAVMYRSLITEYKLKNLQLWTKDLKRFTKSQSVKDGK